MENHQFLNFSAEGISATGTQSENGIVSGSWVKKEITAVASLKYSTTVLPSFSYGRPDKRAFLSREQEPLSTSADSHHPAHRLLIGGSHPLTDQEISKFWKTEPSWMVTIFSAEYGEGDKKEKQKKSGNPGFQEFPEPLCSSFGG